MTLTNAGSVDDAAVNTNLTIWLNSGTIARDMARLAAFITDLANSIERTSVGSGTIPRNMPLHMSILLA